MFSGWDKVLKAFGMKPSTQAATALPVEKITATARYGGGESPEHKALKEYVSRHPEIVHLPKRIAHGTTEHEFESADTIDVLFIHGDEWVGVEIKLALSPEPDVIRGLFQCVKYQALIEAQQRYRGLPLRSRVALVLGGKLAANLVRLKHLLGVDVIEGVAMPKAKAAAAN